MMTSFTYLHLRFECVALDNLRFDPRQAGNDLRNAIANTLLNATCTATTRPTKPTPEHAAECPACFLLSAGTESGRVARGYSFVPPIPMPTTLPRGTSFAFGLTLYGQAQTYLPYFLLSIAEAGQKGVGIGRGKFALTQVWNINPLSHHKEHLYSSLTSNLLQQPTLAITWADLEHLLPQWQKLLHQQKNCLTLHFYTPLRLEKKGILSQTPDFGVLFQRLLFRIDELGQEWAGLGSRTQTEVQTLHQAAQKVHLVEQKTKWYELWSYSRRKQSQTPMSGLMGSATYWAEDWESLLPWLLWGQGVQVGKSATKGNGVYEVNGSQYWHWLQQPAGESKSSLNHPSFR